MPLVKPISGHTKLEACQNYLEKEERALARDFINLTASMVDIDEDGLPIYGHYSWSTVMDTTREVLGSDTPWRGKAARTYKHYVFSPDPKDEIDLTALRELTLEWEQENFGDYEVAIVYHDDNEHHIPHAHVVVNNTNLETGKRLQDPDPRALKRSAQRIASEHGLSFFADKPYVVRKAVQRTEQELTSREEYSWVADIRARVDVARGISMTLEELCACLGAMGIVVRDSASRRGDWVFALAETPSRQVTGSRLGATYAKSYVTSELSTAVPTPLLDDKAAIQSIAGNAIEVSDLSELTHLAEAVRTVSQGGFKSLAGLDAAITRVRQDGKHPATLERIIRVRSYCEAHDMLPRHPAKERPVMRREFEKRSDYHPHDIPEKSHSHEATRLMPVPLPEHSRGHER